jgi:hypothetical protein
MRYEIIGFVLAKPKKEFGRVLLFFVYSCSVQYMYFVNKLSGMNWFDLNRRVGPRAHTEKNTQLFTSLVPYITTTLISDKLWNTDGKLPLKMWAR